MATYAVVRYLYQKCNHLHGTVRNYFNFVYIIKNSTPIWDWKRSLDRGQAASILDYGSILCSESVVLYNFFSLCYTMHLTGRSYKSIRTCACLSATGNTNSRSQLWWALVHCSCSASAMRSHELEQWTCAHLAARSCSITLWLGKNHRPRAR